MIISELAPQNGHKIRTLQLLLGFDRITTVLGSLFLKKVFSEIFEKGCGRNVPEETFEENSKSSNTKTNFDSILKQKLPL